jgi:hypothetical protein
LPEPLQAKTSSERMTQPEMPGAVTKMLTDQSPTGTTRSLRQAARTERGRASASVWRHDKNLTLYSLPKAIVYSAVGEEGNGPG